MQKKNFWQWNVTAVLPEDYTAIASDTGAATAALKQWYNARKILRINNTVHFQDIRYIVVKM